ncbi:uncharacterized protein LOC108606530 [Drosophila busckii]|uniref:uncharacterized protein LOC108606530 n=1 Tax=Drosophila busckii TaxID=30019 RepID=UPI00083F17D4|nr:uncharacterized protein LOC108606530 [Drosophila busckii]
MAFSIKQLLAICILATLACTGYAIKCYQCESITSPKCGEHFEADARNLVDCSRFAPPSFLQSFYPVRNATGCMKKVIDVPGRPQIVRSCYFGDISHTETGCRADPALPFVKQMSCDVCAKDECNGSSSLAPIAGAILLFFGVARLLA